MPLYEEIEIEDMTFDAKEQTYSYPCPCGDRFKISLEDLWDGEDIADCQSCTLFITVIYEEENLPKLRDDDDSDGEDGDAPAEKTEGKTQEDKAETQRVVDAVASLSIEAKS
jgi:diphthamide biosynthesis protein 3